MTYVFAGDSWAVKGYTKENYHDGRQHFTPGDQRLADFWPYKYQPCLTPGRGNLEYIDTLKRMNIANDVPIIWIFTEPGRDYKRITGNDEFGWIQSEDMFEIRQHLMQETLARIKNEISNPIAFIGGLSDVDQDLAESLGYYVLCPSWQRWIAETLNSQWFKFGWGAADIGWRMHSDNVVPSKAATFAWDEQIKEWCWWEENGYFCHEHPSPKSNLEFAEFLKPKVIKWLSQF